ncbi:hypothetical protein KAU45_11330 [bacterium]|nr:hypothetical protein [bacterium]
MYWITYLALIVGGVLGAASLIIKKKPEAADIIGKISPYQGIIGIVLLVWGIIKLLSAFAWLGAGLAGIVGFATAIVMILLGFLLGFSLIAKFLGEKGENLFKKISPFQGILGIIGILVGLFWLLANFGIFGEGFQWAAWLF